MLGFNLTRDWLDKPSKTAAQVVGTSNSAERDFIKEAALLQLLETLTIGIGLTRKGGEKRFKPVTILASLTAAPLEVFAMGIENYSCQVVCLAAGFE